MWCTAYGICEMTPLPTKPFHWRVINIAGETAYVCSRKDYGASSTIENSTNPNPVCHCPKCKTKIKGLWKKNGIYSWLSMETNQMFRDVCNTCDAVLYIATDDKWGK